MEIVKLTDRGFFKNLWKHTPIFQVKHLIAQGFSTLYDFFEVPMYLVNFIKKYCKASKKCPWLSNLLLFLPLFLVFFEFLMKKSLTKCLFLFKIIDMDPAQPEPTHLTLSTWLTKKTHYCIPEILLSHGPISNVSKLPMPKAQIGLETLN